METQRGGKACATRKDLTVQSIPSGFWKFFREIFPQVTTQCDRGRSLHRQNFTVMTPGSVCICILSTHEYRNFLKKITEQVNERKKRKKGIQNMHIQTIDSNAIHNGISAWRNPFKFVTLKDTIHQQNIYYKIFIKKTSCCGLYTRGVRCLIKLNAKITRTYVVLAMTQIMGKKLSPTIIPAQWQTTFYQKKLNLSKRGETINSTRL